MKLVIVIFCIVVALAGAAIGWWMSHHDEDYFD